MFFDRRRAWAVSYWLICIVLHDDTRVKRLVWVFIVCVEIVGIISLMLTGYSGCSGFSSFSGFPNVPSDASEIIAIYPLPQEGGQGG